MRRQRRSSVEGESELAFAHMLVRDVAYGQIPRAERAQKHRAVAEWIESLGRPEDHAEMLAYHWSSALELARASGRDADELVERTRLALRAAGDRAFALNSYAAAAAHYDDALALWPERRRAALLLFQLAVALHLSYDDARQQEALEVARDAFLAVGDTERASEAESFLVRVFWERGQHDAAFEHLERAEKLAGDSVSVAAARVLSFAARVRRSRARRRGASPRRGRVRDGERARARRAPRPFAHDDRNGEERLGLRVGRRRHAARARDRARGRLPVFGDDRQQPRGVRDAGRRLPTHGGALRRGLRLGERYGDAGTVRFVRGNVIWLDYMLGRWDQALESANDFIAECEAGSPHTLELFVREERAGILLARGDWPAPFATSHTFAASGS